MTQSGAGALTPTHNGILQFQRLLGQLPAAAYTCDSDGLITYYNQRAADLWGRTPRLNHVADRYCGSYKLFGADGAPVSHDRCWMALALMEGKEYNGEEIIVERPDGSRLTGLAHANPFIDQAGKVFGGVNVVVDISERKRVEESLRRADQSKNDFLAMLAHELRNPLAPLRNGLQIVRMEGSSGPMGAEALMMMERQLGHMVRLIDDLLDVSRITKGKFKLRRDRVELSAVIQDAVEMSHQLIASADHRLTVALPAEPVTVDADRTRLVQVFANLLNNSAEFTPPGGDIRLTAERVGTDLVVKVSDNGAGIPSDMLPRIFDTFTQVDSALERPQGGLGIGLSLVRGLVELHHGTVEARSDGPGRGSEFIVRLSDVVTPAARAGPADDETGKSSIETASYRILVVDDNQDAALSLAMMLNLIGHQTRTVHDGVAAVEMAAAFRPQIVLMDIGLPKLNGYDACRRIREQAGSDSMVLIALTGWGQDEDKRRATEAGFNFHLIKPVEPDALNKLLSGLLLPPDDLPVPCK